MWSWNEIYSDDWTHGVCFTPSWFHMVTEETIDLSEYVEKGVV